MIDNHRSTIAYRPDIDGLRAVAIAPVVLYHADIAAFGGGYVGVDVFFVISGYLITSLILGEIERDAFSLRYFYLRRIRRIFPALFLMLVLCALVGWSLLAPHDYKELGQSILATVFFSSNILFWLKSGYFAAPIEARPLLHTWSLAVEEQFYLFFPVLLMLLSRFARRRVVPITLLLCVASFGLNIATVASEPKFAFFLAPPRIWELFIGALLAMGVIGPPLNWMWREGAGVLGLAFIATAVFSFSSETKFPGYAALLPVLGAASIVWAGIGQSGAVSRVLSHPLPVLIGKISYSFYLWHFPLLAFAAYAVTGGPGLAARLALVVLSMIAALMTWRFIELPIRQGRGVFGNRSAVFGISAAALIAFSGFGLAAHLTKGFPARIGDKGLDILASASDFDSDRARCLITTATVDIRQQLSCKFGLADAAEQVVLWGDSHAESLRPALDDSAKRLGRAGVFLGASGCIPEIGFDRQTPGCSAVNDAIIRFLVSTPSITTVVLAGRWGLWAEGTPYKNEGGTRINLTDTAGVFVDNHRAVSTGLERAVAELAKSGKEVWLIGPIPEVGYDVPRALYLDWLGVPRKIDIHPTASDFEARQKFVRELLERLSSRYLAHIIWPHLVFCEAGLCAVQRDGRALYIDDQHLTRAAAQSISRLFDPVFSVRQKAD
jgi:peptidoglycan/LPS O-acetylase OafA/YrhL